MGLTKQREKNKKRNINVGLNKIKKVDLMWGSAKLRKQSKYVTLLKE